MWPPSPFAYFGFLSFQVQSAQSIKSVVLKEITSKTVFTMTNRLSVLVTTFLLVLQPGVAFQQGFPSPFLFGKPSLSSSMARGPLNAEPTTGSSASSSQTANQLKELLVQKISEFRHLKERDGDLSIEFGVKGGELNETSYAPQKVNFYSISKDVGDKAVEVIQICDQLAECSPIDDPTRFLGDKEQGTLAPLNGPWKSLFTTAADANFSKNSKRGAAKVQNIVDATKGTITNVIDFATKEDGTEPLLKQLNVVIRGTAVSAKRVELQFRLVKAVLTKLFFFKFRWTLYIPVPGPFLTRCVVFLNRIVKFGRGGAKTVPKGYFDVLYLDDELRVHRTGEDNLFVQARESWQSAKPLLV
jgi:hypothetical protein